MLVLHWYSCIVLGLIPPYNWLYFTESTRLVQLAKEGNLLRTASEPHILPFYTQPQLTFLALVPWFEGGLEALWGCALPHIGKMRFRSCAGKVAFPWSSYDPFTSL